MTDEEKAEKYIRTDGTNGEKVWDKIHKEFPNCIVVKSTKSKERLSELFFEYTRVVYLDGLAEGRKELEQWKQEWQDAQIKANEEGFARTTLQIKYLEIEKENKELLDKLNLQNQRLNELKKENEELKAQIEQMKNFVKSMYEANKNDAYCREYLGTILNEWS